VSIVELQIACSLASDRIQISTDRLKVNPMFPTHRVLLFTSYREVFRPDVILNYSWSGSKTRRHSAPLNITSQITDHAEKIKADNPAWVTGFR